MRALLSNLTPMKAIAMLAGAFIMLTIWILNSVFTFTYGYEVVGPFLLVAQLGDEGSRLLSGLTAFLFYDAAYTVAFLTLLFACSSIWQYAVTAVQFSICFLLSIGASVISILLLSPLATTVSPDMLTIAAYGGYAGLVIGFIVNSLATIGYIAASPHMAQAINISVRRAKELATTNAANDKLDDESQKLAVASIEQQIPTLAAQRAAGMYLSYLASIGGSISHPAIPASVNGTSHAPQQLAAEGQPAPVIRRRRRVVNEGNGYQTEVARRPIPPRS